MSDSKNAALRTRYLLLVVLTFLPAAYADIKYGHTAGWLYLGAGFVTALMIGSAIGAVVARRDRRRVGL